MKSQLVNSLQSAIRYLQSAIRKSYLTGRRKAVLNSDNIKKRVVVTGIGLVSPLGNTTEETWAGLIAGRSGVDYITRFDTSQHTVKFAAETKSFDPAKDRKSVV